MTHFPLGTPPYILKHLVEREAQNFRTYLGFDEVEPLDALEVAELLGLDVRDPAKLLLLDASTRAALATRDRDKWSGMTFYLPNGDVVTVLNPTHSRARRNATLLEEVSHVHLRHASSALAVDPRTGLLTRSYDPLTEREAYWFGTAVLVPKLGLKQLYGRGLDLVAAARHYDVSLDLVRMRSQLHGLPRRAS